MAAVLDKRSPRNSSAARLNVRAGRSRKAVQRPSTELLARLRDWIEREITFVEHPVFCDRKAVGKIDSLRPSSLDQPPPPAKLEPGLAFVAGMVEMPLLSLEEEQYLFTWMNFLKCRAEGNRRRLSLNAPDQKLLECIEKDINDATKTRNRIVQSNLRLVVSLAKKLSVSVQGGAIDQMSDLISEGTLPLIRAVELFDISLGNRFSTYATWAVRNQMLRSLKRRHKQIDGGVIEDELWLGKLADNRHNPEDEELNSLHRVQLVQRLLQQLTERERIIIAARFGLDGQPHGQSLNDIAQQLGLSKERVRQIVLSSLEKLHEVVGDADVE